MTDKELQELIDLTIEAKNSYHVVLDALENEYKRRFGYLPSEVEDDNFIDTFHYKQRKKMTVEELKFFAEGREKRN